jgi:hypothetical protein
MVPISTHMHARFRPYPPMWTPPASSMTFVLPRDYRNQLSVGNTVYSTSHHRHVRDAPEAQGGVYGTVGNVPSARTNAALRNSWAVLSGH